VKWEAGTAVKFAAVGLIGLLTDMVLLRLCMAAGTSPAVARAISLFCAMQITFTVNGLFVFRCLTAEKLGGQWAGYMATSGFGNFCNYWIFVTLVSFHGPVLSNPYVALLVGAFCAYLINYAGARLWVFGKGKGHVVIAARHRPSNRDSAGVEGRLALAALRGGDATAHQLDA